MKKFGLIGHPIDQSKSPLLFNAAYGGKYRYDLIEGDDFEKSYARFLQEYDGINVTAPFKELAAAKADSRSKMVERLGAANLLVKTPEGVHALNTDFAGIVLAIIDGVLPSGGEEYYNLYRWDLTAFKKLMPKIFPNRPKALIVGCGGAGKAASAVAGEMGYETTLINRTKSRAEEIARKLPEYNFKVGEFEDFNNLLRGNDLIIYTLPEKIPAIDKIKCDDFMPNGKIILEANYKNPAFSDRVGKMIAESGCQYVPGRRWLLYQALAGYGFFTGEYPDFDKMDKEFV